MAAPEVVQIDAVHDHGLQQAADGKMKLIMPSPKTKQPPFEELYRQLEEKVVLLEQGGLSLDDSVAAYEAAVTLAQRCQQLLDGAELRITRLRQTIAAAEPDAFGAETGDDEDEV
jgi:exodeoxyribonuclease VII small subunit